MQKNRMVELRVGLFVVAALAVGTLIVFTIGSRKNVFGSKQPYRATFATVGGLRPGSQLSMAGVDIGTVGEVELRPDGRIHVRLDVHDAYVPLVRNDTVASIGAKGLLGDKLVELTVGRGTTLPPGGQLRTEEPLDVARLTARAGAILTQAEEVVGNLRAATGVLGEPGFQQDVRSATHSVAELLRMTEQSDGTVRRLLTDPQLADQVGQTLSNAQAATDELARTARSARNIAEEVERGDGTAHELIYGQEGTRLARSLADTASETSQLLASVRTGDGTLHDLIYEDEADALLANVTGAAAEMNTILRNLREGRGTIGALLTDPTIYEDVKRLVGDLQRNEILRALVRYSIRNDESREQPAVAPR
jgi:phospholipid/cholesterol/gamma-HCH transport system substrate-binding protein